MSWGHVWGPAPADKFTLADVTATKAAVSGDWIQNDVPRVLGPVDAQMPSAPTVTTSTASAVSDAGRWGSVVPRLIPQLGNGDSNFPYHGGGIVMSANSAVSVSARTLTTLDAAGTQFATQTLRHSFMFDGSTVEFQNQSGGGAYWIKVDDQYISPAGTTLAPDAVVRYIKLPFGTRRNARIEWFAYGLGIGSIRVDPTASVTPAPVRGPFVIMQGDSFCATETTYVRAVSDALRWDNISSSGMGGTGVVTANSTRSFEQRMEHDILLALPDVYWVVGSINDAGSSAADYVAALLRMRAAYLAAKPTGTFVWSMNCPNRGPSHWQVSSNLQRWAARAALKGLPNTYVVDVLEMPVYTDSQIPNAVLKNAVSVGDSVLTLRGTWASGGYPAPGANVRIDNEVFEIGGPASFDGADGTGYWFGAPLVGTAQAAHAAGAPWRVVGAGYVNGIGSAGTPTGYGTADIYRISAGDLHPTMLGGAAFGRALANEFQRVVLGGAVA